MKELSLLKQFEFSIPASSMSVASLNRTYAVAKHLPLMKLNIDFEKGELKLEGDWQFMVVFNKHNDAKIVTTNRERVKIDASIYPVFAINLHDPYNDGLALPLEGSIREGSFLGSCTGLLVMDNVRRGNGLISNQWDISFYLYEQLLDCCEISFKIPVYDQGMNSDLN